MGDAFEFDEPVEDEVEFVGEKHGQLEVELEFEHSPADDSIEVS